LSCKLNIPPLIASFRVVFCINGSTAAHSSQQKQVFIGTLQEALTGSKHLMQPMCSEIEPYTIPTNQM